MADYTSPEDEQFFGALGRLAISWGHIEFGIDAFVVLLHWRFGGHQVERVMPWALQRKLDYEEPKILSQTLFCVSSDSDRAYLPIDR